VPLLSAQHRMTAIFSIVSVCANFTNNLSELVKKQNRIAKDALMFLIEQDKT